MLDFTQAAIDQLIACRKTIVEPPKRSMVSVNGSMRNDMTVRSSAANADRFRVFMRMSEKFEEDFSVGLRYEVPNGGGLTLLRCNGPHGGVVNGMDCHPHFGYHIHRALEDNLREGWLPERGAKITTEYATYRQALRYFLKLANIQWTDAEFPGLEQLELI